MFESTVANVAQDDQGPESEVAVEYTYDRSEKGAPPWMLETTCVVIGIPSCEMRSKHVIAAILLQYRGCFDVIRPQVGRAGDIEVICR